MKGAIPAVLLLAASCVEPPKQNRAAIYLEGLQDLWRWDPMKGGAGNPFYDGLFSLEPADAVPFIIRGVNDLSPTKIDDQIHPPPFVGDVCFYMLLQIFNLAPKDFDREGVWVLKHETNPIYAVRLDDASVRLRVSEKFRKLAIGRGWTGEPPP